MCSELSCPEHGSENRRQAQLEELNPVFVVAVYDSWRSFGGAEEGGWWYTEGELRSLGGAFGTEDEAWEAAADLRSDLELTQDRHSFTVDVVKLPRWDLVPALRGQQCHLWDVELRDEDYVLRFDVPNSFPEGRPHYC